MACLPGLSTNTIPIAFDAFDDAARALKELGLTRFSVKAALKLRPHRILTFGPNRDGCPELAFGRLGAGH